MKDLRQSLQREIVVRVDFKCSLVVVGCLFEVLRVFVGSCQVVEVVSIMPVYLDGFIIVFNSLFIVLGRVIGDA